MSTINEDSLKLNMRRRHVVERTVLLLRASLVRKSR